jgi:hypothetical protein
VNLEDNLAKFYTFAPGQQKPKTPLEKYKEKMAEVRPEIKQLIVLKNVPAKPSHIPLILTICIIVENLVLLYFWCK